MQARWLLMALVAVALAHPAAAQEMPAFTQAYQVRIGQGDIPTTTFHEGAGWHLAQTLSLKHVQGAATQLTFHLPTGSTLANVTCSCGPAVTTTSGTTVDVSIASPMASGTHKVEVVADVESGDALGLTWTLPTVPSTSQTGDASQGLLVVYTATAVPAVEVASPLADERVLPGANGSPWTIHYWEASEASPMPQTMWVAVHPGMPVAAPSEGDGFPWLYVAGGVLLGVVLWAFLVSRGVVQKRSRKQVAVAAAHEELAKREPLALLEARKRALMAALKEVELAKMNKEMDDASYDAVKAELKQETVAVMRAIEESPRSQT